MEKAKDDPPSRASGSVGEMVTALRRGLIHLQWCDQVPGYEPSRAPAGTWRDGPPQRGVRRKPTCSRCIADRGALLALLSAGAALIIAQRFHGPSSP
jgi:hypothetical protein